MVRLPQPVGHAGRQCYFERLERQALALPPCPRGKQKPRRVAGAGSWDCSHSGRGDAAEGPAMLIRLRTLSSVRDCEFII